MIILTGTFLLMLPVASANSTSTGFLDCLFTATSASCVTGLVIMIHFTLVCLWTVGYFGVNSDRRTGIYDGWRFFCDCAQKEDWS